MHRLSTSFLLGYQGCDRDVGEGILNGDAFKTSKNDYDWLGWGVYFWESNPLRGLEFAKELQSRRSGKNAPIKEPWVIGAVIDPGFCLDLLSSTGIRAVSAVYDDFVQVCDAAGISVPDNVGGADLLLRNLDCAVINHMHTVRELAGIPSFDTVRGVFLEGPRIYPNAGFFEKTHIQICVRNLACIKGAFKVPEEQLAD